MNNQEWYEAHSRYRHAVETEREIITINRQNYQLNYLKETLREFNKLFVSELKDKIENEFARYIAIMFKNKLQEAFAKTDPHLNDLIELKFSRSDFLFLSPAQSEKEIIDQYKLHFQSRAVFDINLRLVPDKITIFRIYIPEFQANYAETL